MGAIFQTFPLPNTSSTYKLYILHVTRDFTSLFLIFSFLCASAIIIVNREHYYCVTNYVIRSSRELEAPSAFLENLQRKKSRQILHNRAN